MSWWYDYVDALINGVYMDLYYKYDFIYGFISMRLECGGDPHYRRVECQCPSACVIPEWSVYVE
jgi:hypothetical protein